MSSRNKTVKKFKQQTGASHSEALHFLEAANDDFDTALALYGGNRPSTSNNSTTIQSDAELAAKLSSELNAANEEVEVRPPIPRKFDILLPPEAPLFNALPQSVHSGPRNFAAEIREQEMRLGLAQNIFRGSGEASNKINAMYCPPVELLFKGTFNEALSYAKHHNKFLLVNIGNSINFSSHVLNHDLWKKKSVRNFIEENLIFWQAECYSEQGSYYTQFYPVKDTPHVALIEPRTGQRLKEMDQDKLHITQRSKMEASFHEFVKEFQSEYGCTPQQYFDIVNGTNKRKCDSSPQTNCKRQRLDESASTSSKMNGHSNNVPFSHASGSSNSLNQKKSIVECDENEQMRRAIEESLKTAAQNNLDSDDDFRSDSSLSPRSDSSLISSEFLADPLETISSPKKSSNESNEYSGGLGESWQDICARYPHGEKYSILFRLPEGERENITLPAAAPLTVIRAFLRSKGFLPPAYKAFTGWPRKDIFDMDSSVLLSESGLVARDTIIIQKE